MGLVVIEKVSYLEHEVVSFFSTHWLKYTIGASLTLASRPFLLDHFCKAQERQCREWLSASSQCNWLQDNKPGKCPKAFFSFKFKNSGLHYELGNNIQTGEKSWICGPLPLGDWKSFILVWRSISKRMRGWRQMTDMLGKTLVLRSVQLVCITWRMSIGSANAARSRTRAKLSIITSRLSKSLEEPFAMILRSIACASKPVLFLYSFPLKLVAKSSLTSQTMTKHGWIQLESPCRTGRMKWKCKCRHTSKMYRHLVQSECHEYSSIAVSYGVLTLASHEKQVFFISRIPQNLPNMYSHLPWSDGQTHKVFALKARFGELPVFCTFLSCCQCHQYSCPHTSRFL